jgi:uncharacterized protein YbjT (DUF2867 family)
MARKDEDLILVVGATGQQGGAVARHLLDAGRAIRVLTRDRSKAAHLAERGAEVVEGDMTDRASLKRPLRGAGGVYGMTTPFEFGMEAEVKQGVTLADAARDAGVRHFVFSSVVSADKETGIPHFETKAEIERHIRKIGLPATILRPASFMENFLSPRTWPMIKAGKLVMPMRRDTSLQMIALNDIGVFGAAAFEDPESYIGRTISLAGDQATMPEAVRVIGKALGREIAFETLPPGKAAEVLGEDLAIMYRWFNETGTDIDIDALEERHGILMTSFEEWVETTEWPE